MAEETLPIIVHILLFGMPLKSLCLGGRTTRWLLFIAAGSIFFIAFVYAAVVSKFLTQSDKAFVLSVHKDRYYCFLVPLMFPILVVVIYFHWLSMKLFKHA